MVFSHTDKPLEADDWLRDMERKLNIAQCTDQEKVLYASHYFSGTAASWWENIRHTHGAVITWEQFKEYFRGAHIPNSVMKMKKREFEDLKQRGTTVTQYLDQFTQLSRYANDEYMTEDRKMEKFLDGLVPSLKCQLVVHTFPDFKTLVDKAIILENEHRSINEICKRRMTQSEQVRSNRPRTDFQRLVAPRLSIPAPRPPNPAP